MRALTKSLQQQQTLGQGQVKWQGRQHSKVMMEMREWLSCLMMMKKKRWVVQGSTSGEQKPTAID
jgi:hypothetical protein